MFTKTHPTWRLAAGNLRRMIASNYREHPAQIVMGVTDLGMTTQVHYDQDESRLVLGPALFTGVDEPAPLGQPSELNYQLQQPCLFGAIASTFAPSQHSPWRRIVAEGPAPDPGDYRSALVLDQMRAEQREVGRRPVTRLMMQAYLGSTLPPSPAPSTARAAVEAALAIHARITAGVISGEAVAGLPALLLRTVENIVGKETTTRLLAVITHALEADGANPAEMLGLGHQWHRILAGLPEVDEDQFDLVDLHLWRCGEVITQAAVREVALLQLKYPPALQPPPRKLPPMTPDEWAAALEDRIEDATATGEQDQPSTGTDDDHLTRTIGIPHSRWISYREPTDEERGKLISMTRQLRDLRYRQPRMVQAPSQIPRGRLDTRQLVQYTAQRTNGTTITATPWRREAREATDQPGLTCALVLDTSLSMGLFRDELLSLNWILAQATTAVGGTISTWGFGGDAFEVIRAGTQPRLVPTVVDTGATSEGSARALANAAADAQLHVAEGTRVAVVVTDAALDAQELADLDAVFGSLRDTGVHTLLVRVGNQSVSAQTQQAEVVECRWGSDLAPTVTERIISAYAPG
jgi:hypothetical protein